jgi:hypothetical protein
VSKKTKRPRRIREKHPWWVAMTAGIDYRCTTHETDGGEIEMKNRYMMKMSHFYPLRSGEGEREKII